jgi:hypothetical protein
LTVTDSDNPKQRVNPPRIAAKVCEVLCDKPCDGAVLVCQYIPWFFKPPVSGVRLIGIQYEFTEIAELNITTDTGDQLMVNLRETIMKLFSNFNNAILNTNYDEIMSKLCELMTKFTENEANVKGIKNFVFKFGYDKSSQMIVIETYKCYKFTFLHLFGYRYLEVGSQFRYLYSQEASGNETVVTSRQSSMTFPAVNRLENNICTGKKDTPKPTFTPKLIVDGGKGKPVDVSVILPQLTCKPKFHWFAESGDPLFSDKPTFSFKPSGNGKVRLLLFDPNDGCWAYIEEAF